jgi:HK97 family phage portal protein
VGHPEGEGRVSLFDFRRKSGPITTPAQLSSYLLRHGSGENATGLDVNPTTAIQHGTVFACVRVLAESVAQLPLQLYREDGREKTKAYEHPLYRVLNGVANPLQTSQEWLELVVAHLCLAGNHYSLINRGAVGTQVLELLPLNPGAVSPILSPDGADIAYRVTFANKRQEVLTSRDVLHIKGFSLDGVCGVSPISYARETIGLSMATQRHAARLFSNGANPGGVLEVSSELSDAAYKRMKDSWDSGQTGVNNAHRTAILEAGTKWTQIGLSAEDSQMLESRKYSRTEICGLFRVPPAMIGDLERATFSNTEQQARSFVDFSLAPWLLRIESRVWMQLLEAREQKTLFARFNRNALMGADATTRSNFYTRQLQNGAMSPNEIRELEDLNPREGGDVYLTPLNMLIDGKPPPDSSGGTP